MLKTMAMCMDWNFIGKCRHLKLARNAYHSHASVQTNVRFYVRVFSLLYVCRVSLKADIPGINVSSNETAYPPRIRYLLLIKYGGYTTGISNEISQHGAERTKRATIFKLRLIPGDAFGTPSILFSIISPRFISIINLRFEMFFKVRYLRSSIVASLWFIKFWQSPRRCKNKSSAKNLQT